VLQGMAGGYIALRASFFESANRLLILRLGYFCPLPVYFRRMSMRQRPQISPGAGHVHLAAGVRASMKVVNQQLNREGLKPALETIRHDSISAESNTGSITHYGHFERSERSCAHSERRAGAAFFGGLPFPLRTTSQTIETEM
jgi:hypothetical protein